MSKVTDILAEFQTKFKEREAGSIKSLENNAETWSRIAENDDFAELGFSTAAEKEEFLKEWISDNPYSNI